ncbi:helix-turn-helix domain-containing protein [Streptomyces sp. BH105]|uniref:helix-turn-helix domain-containing protein n=1 Tax=Streptomyces sp. BH105 TaxID=3410408 RepID=UPI003CF57060
MAAVAYAKLDLGQGGELAGQIGPTLRQQRFGTELRRLREQAGVGQKEAGAHIDGDQSKMSRIEKGRTRPKRLEVQALLDLYRVEGDEERARVLDLWKAGTSKQYLPEYDLRADMREMVELEASCTRMEMFATMHLPGLLQTDKYAAALIGGFEPTLEEADVKHYVDLRMDRQKILEREDPPQVVCILDEGVVHRPIGGPEVMAQQLAHLLELAKRPSVTIQVVPFDQAVYDGLHGAFRTLVNDDASALDVVEISTRTKTLYMQDGADVEAYRKHFDAIRSAALSSRQSAQLITQAMRNHKE